jgi:Restriction endonuclease
MAGRASRRYDYGRFLPEQHTLRLPLPQRSCHMTDAPSASPLMHALEQFDATEANITKLQSLWAEIEGLIPQGISFGDNPEYDDRTRAFIAILKALPAIDGWKPSVEILDLNTIAQTRFDYADIGEPGAAIQFDADLALPGRELREYRFRFDHKRRALVREPLTSLIDSVDVSLRQHREGIGAEPPTTMHGDSWDELRGFIDQIGVLMGTSIKRPPRWSDLQRHLSFGDYGDFQDIERLDWPNVKTALRAGLYGQNDPLPVAVDDLGTLVTSKPAGAVTTALNWSALDDAGFERLIFNLIGSTPGYENPEWLMKTRAADIGRDLSVTRVLSDALSGTSRARIVIQCKHWLSRSLSVDDIGPALSQMALWRDPPVDVLIIATSGRFTATAVQWIEKHNTTSGSAPKIEMWPESHLERLLAARPALIAEFKLR